MNSNVMIKIGAVNGINRTFVFIFFYGTDSYLQRKLLARLLTFNVMMLAPASTLAGSLYCFTAISVIANVILSKI